MVYAHSYLMLSIVNELKELYINLLLWSTLTLFIAWQTFMCLCRLFLGSIFNSLIVPKHHREHVVSLTTRCSPATIAFSVPMNFLAPTVEIKFKTVDLKVLNSCCASDSMLFLLDADHFSFYFSRLLLVLEVLHLVINTKADY